MKFLLDAHLPKKLSTFLSWKGYDSIHTLDLPNKNATKDSEINQISLDEQRVVISNKPYKLIYIATGNITNKRLLEIFSQNIIKIVEYATEHRLIEITNESIVVKG